MVLRRSPLPDEIARAYKGRLIRDNGWSDQNEAMQSLLEWAGSGGANRREVSTVELLAKVAGMGTSKFVTEHTTVPLRRAVVARPPCVPHGSPEQGSLLWAMALRHIRPGAYFCVKCVDEDFDFHGTPYWRRDHQLPGVTWCSKHGIALSYVETADAFRSSPTAFLDNHAVVSVPWVAELQKSAPVQRFLAISADLLARTRPLDELNVSRAARARAMDLGLHTGRGAVRKPLLSDLVKQRFDKDWLASVVPGLVDKQAGEHWQPVDGAVSGKRACVGSVVYALVFAALFESEDDAIHSMTAATSPEKCPMPQRLETSQIDDEQLRTAYIATNGCHRAVAAQINIDEYVVKKRLGELGLPPLGNLNPVRLKDTLTAVLHRNLSLSRACGETHLALDDVKAALSSALEPLDSALGQITGAGSKRKSAPRLRPIPPPMQKAPSVTPGSLLERTSRRRSS